MATELTHCVPWCLLQDNPTSRWVAPFNSTTSRHGPIRVKSARWEFKLPGSLQKSLKFFLFSNISFSVTCLPKSRPLFDSNLWPKNCESTLGMFKVISTNALHARHHARVAHGGVVGNLVGFGTKTLKFRKKFFWDEATKKTDFQKEKKKYPLKQDSEVFFSPL